MPNLRAYLQQIAVAKRLCRIIFWAGALTLLVVGIGTGFALRQNWLVRLETSTAALIRTAEMANWVVEADLLDATKALDASKRELETALDQGVLTPQHAYLILMRANQGLSVHDQSKPLKLRFWIDAHGALLARSDEYPKAAPQDYSDRLYFKDLRAHPEKKWSIGPLVWLPLSQQWVFHMAIPIQDRAGQFGGVLVQQILKSEISNDLARYLDPSDMGQVMTHFGGGSVSLDFRKTEPGAVAGSPVDVLQAWNHARLNSPANRGTATWILEPNGQAQETLVGFAQYPLFGLMGFAMLPMDALVRSFLWDNHYLLVYVALGVLFVIATFYQLHGIAVQLTLAVDKSLHDPLTKLHNRRALDETLPGLLRASMREKTPITVLFMDIDFFRRFNEEFGHETGDTALVAVAQTLATCCRRPMDFLCRWGGEEFVAVLPNTDAGGAEKVAADMLHAVRHIRLQSLTGQAMDMTVSIGSVTATVTNHNRTDDLIDCADKAMQTAKARGRNQHVMWQPAPRTKGHI